MIITVTLNAAIDKSLSVPNFRLGRRHRTVEQRTMAAGRAGDTEREAGHGEALEILNAHDDRTPNVRPVTPRWDS